MKGRAVEVGTRRVTATGFITVKVGKDHPYENGTGWQLEHRLRMMESLGRRLGPTERVMHLDGDRANNDPANLHLVQKQPPPPHCRTCACQ